MNPKSLLLLGSLASLLAVAACSHKPPAPTPRPAAEPSPERLPTPPQVRRPSKGPGGHYSAGYVSGDYAGYPALERFIDKMVDQHGYSRDYLNGLFSQAQRKDWTLDYMTKDHKAAGKPSPGGWSRYRSKFLTEQHISSGAAFWAAHESALRRAAEEYGVSPAHIMGIMGVETLYGRNLGTHRIIDALTTLAFDYPRRSEYFTEELENFLVMAQQEGFDPSKPKGSFAGAMGLGQFMPSSYLKYAVDFDGDGRRNLWDPEDAIGSIANYFAGHGWQRGEPVVTRAHADGPAAKELESGFNTKYSLGELSGYGIYPDGVSPGATQFRLLRLSTNNGDEYWLGYENFYVITRYNHSTHYAMAVHQLAEAIKRRHGGDLAMR
jgi:membrane-bound lytic murein transglycosylase B